MKKIGWQNEFWSCYKPINAKLKLNSIDLRQTGLGKNRWSLKVAPLGIPRVQNEQCFPYSSSLCVCISEPIQEPWDFPKHKKKLVVPCYSRTPGWNEVACHNIYVLKKKNSSHNVLTTEVKTQNNNSLET